jgi:hypothetical protein
MADGAQQQERAQAGGCGVWQTFCLFDKYLRKTTTERLELF